MYYNVFPSEALRRARTAHGAYEISETRDDHGRAEVIAVLRMDHRDTGRPALVCAGSVADLVTELTGTRPTGLPQRDRKHAYFEIPPNPPAR
ncbi:hypothetical protein CLV63_1523 [Murinocardiopsis flavida]|uniref:Uncharacterized protein n=1 Tax=Murinocardiopsis flavida TaxID=645275 RepID=A0A2P8C6V2_9ACTN|nr:hypothetical protein [Murinocardiopsis flavida]PSK80696.1 hypothetical protein CLV63_1523 [Murinocardiopsis flavida]